MYWRLPYVSSLGGMRPVGPEGHRDKLWLGTMKGQERPWWMCNFSLMEAPGFEGVIVLRLKLGTLRQGPSLLRKFRTGNWGTYSLFQGRLQHIWDARIVEQPPRTAADMEWSDLSLGEKPYIPIEDRAKNRELSSPFGGRKIMSLRHWELNNLSCWNWFYLILTVPWSFSWNKKVFLIFVLTRTHS